jgi:hypothetical protein
MTGKLPKIKDIFAIPDIPAGIVFGNIRRF